MDLSLPGWDGLSAAYRMRELESRCHVPIVACTAHSAAVHQEVAQEAGCDGYVEKPLDLELLKRVVSRLLAGRGDENRSGEAEARRQRIMSKPMDDESLRDYLDGLIVRYNVPE